MPDISSGETGVVFPTPAPVFRRCRRCRHLARADRMIDGLGSDCAAKLGLTVPAPRVHAAPQDGPDLFDTLVDPPTEPAR